MFGAWGKATLSNKLIQLRSLDWVFSLLFRTWMVLLSTTPLLLSIIPLRNNLDSPG